MTFEKKYLHVGVSYPSTPRSWKPVIKETIIKIEKIMWPSYLPMFIKRWIYLLARGRSIVKIRSNFWYKILNHFTHGMIIMDIKEKFGELRIYGNFNTEINYLIEKTIDRCSRICEDCGKEDGTVKIVKKGGWFYNYCDECFKKN